MPIISYLDDKKNEELSSEEKKMSEDQNERSPRRVLVKTESKTKLGDHMHNQDILIVASKLKKYIKEKHGLNTSGNVMEKLSDIVRVTCDRAVDNAKVEGRKTLMDRDF